MPTVYEIARGSALAPLVFLVLACTPPPDPPPTGAFALARAALDTGDLEAYGRAIQKSADALPEAPDLDPEAWLLFHGLIGRQYDLMAAGAALRAQGAGQPRALLRAMGCHEEALRLDILHATHSVRTDRTAGRVHYRKGTPAISALDGLSFPDLGGVAWHASLHLLHDGRSAEVSIGANRHGLTDLRVSYGSEAQRRPRRLGHDANPLSLIADHWASPALEEWLALPGLARLSLRVLRDEQDMAITRLDLGKDGEMWSLYEDSRSTVDDRLAAARDAALVRVRRAVWGRVRSLAHRPATRDELALPASAWVDPTTPWSPPGWAVHDADPPFGIELSDDRDIVAIAACLHPEGRRAVDLAGNLHWLKD